MYRNAKLCMCNTKANYMILEEPKKYTFYTFCILRIIILTRAQQKIIGYLSGVKHSKFNIDLFFYQIQLDKFFQTPNCILYGTYGVMQLGVWKNLSSCIW
jgi:hypothetical protein